LVGCGGRGAGWGVWLRRFAWRCRFPPRRSAVGSVMEMAAEAGASLAEAFCSKSLGSLSDAPECPRTSPVPERGPLHSRAMAFTLGRRRWTVGRGFWAERDSAPAPPVGMNGESFACVIPHIDAPPVRGCRCLRSAPVMADLRLESWPPSVWDGHNRTGDRWPYNTSIPHPRQPCRRWRIRHQPSALITNARLDLSRPDH